MTNRKRIKPRFFYLLLLLAFVSYGSYGEQQLPKVKVQSSKAAISAQVVTPKPVATIIGDSDLLYTTRRDSAALLQQLYKYKMLNEPKVTLNTQAASYVKKYLKKNSEMLSEVKQRSGDYFSTIAMVFDQYNLPKELQYLAVIESKLKTSATSRVGAAGVWQLMPATARTLGLKVSKKTDERRHLHKSTVAAAKYLKSLYAQYQDWLLVVAAYNSGAGNVNKAIRKSGSRDFWVLQDFLPKETKAHVKHFIGAHCYFEGQGSIVTLTKTERLTYKKAVAEFSAAYQQQAEKLNRAMKLSSSENQNSMF